MGDSTIVAIGVIVPGWCKGYIMKRAVILPKDPNDDIAVIKSYLKLNQECFTLLIDQLYNKLLYIAFGLGIWISCSHKPSCIVTNFPQTTLNPVNYIPVFKKSFTQVSNLSDCIVLYTLVKVQSLSALTTSCVTIILYSLCGCHATNKDFLSYLQTFWAIETYTMLIKKCIKHIFCLVLLYTLPGCRTWKASLNQSLSIILIIPYELLNDENLRFCYSQQTPIYLRYVF